MMLIQTNSPATRTEWVTPKEIIDALGGWEWFDLDPCCPAVMPWRTARRMISLPEDGLAADWFGRVWLNPPFNDAWPWMRRLRDHGNGIALVPVAPDTQWFDDTVFGHAAGILFFSGRLRFHDIDGTRAKGNINRPCCLVAYGAGNLQVIRASGLGAVVVEMEGRK